MSFFVLVGSHQPCAPSLVDPLVVSPLKMSLAPYALGALYPVFLTVMGHGDKHHPA